MSYDIPIDAKFDVDFKNAGVVVKKKRKLPFKIPGQNTDEDAEMEMEEKPGILFSFYENKKN